MSAIDERAAHIRMFTVPDRAVGPSTVLQYAAVAAGWERLRLKINRNPVPVSGDDERFSAMSLFLRQLSAELGLKTCSATTAGTEDVIGITGQQGMLPNDPGYLYSSSWIEHAESWCAEEVCGVSDQPGNRTVVPGIS
jgi:hypothetical protein